MRGRTWRAGIALLLLAGSWLAGCDLGTAAPPPAAPSPTATLVGATSAAIVGTPARPTPLAAAPTPAAPATPSPGAPQPLPTIPLSTAPAPAATGTPAPGATRPGPPTPAPAARPSAGPATRPLTPLATTDIPLPGGTARFDYQSLDPQTGRLFIAHLGASLVTVFDLQTNRVVTNIPAIAGVHGVLAVPALGRVYASATDDNQVAVIRV